MHRVRQFFVGILLGCAILLAISAAPWSPYRFYAVLSGSMAPEIPTGSAVVVVADAPYAVGDVVTLASGIPHTPITHRITAIYDENGERMVRTKGDANVTEDADAHPMVQIVGRVWMTVPFVGRLIAFLRTAEGFVFLIVIPATIVVYHEVLSLVTVAERAIRRRLAADTHHTPKENQ